MRRAAKIDQNQKEIVCALRKVGLSVIFLHAIGAGVPDLLVSSPTQMWLVEIKTEKGKLTPAQVKFHLEWRGVPIIIARNPIEAINQTVGIKCA